MIILFIFIILYTLYILYNYNNNIIKCGNISHGCGLLDSTKYTNSLEAFHNSYSKGFRKIEIDLSVTKDNHIVGAHDWTLFKKMTYYRSDEEINYSYIVKAKILNKYHTIYDYMIYNLLNKYKDVIIVTDKITNYKLLKYYCKKLDRLYVEVPSFDNYYLARKLGFTNLILSIKTINDLKRLFSFLSKGNKLFAIIIGRNLFYSCKSKLLLLFNRNINIYVWNINNITDIKSSYCIYVSGFYID